MELRANAALLLLGLELMCSKLWLSAVLHVQALGTVICLRRLEGVLLPVQMPSLQVPRTCRRLPGCPNLNIPTVLFPSAWQRCGWSFKTAADLICLANVTVLFMQMGRQGSCCKTHVGLHRIASSSNLGQKSKLFGAGWPML